MMLRPDFTFSRAPLVESGCVTWLQLDIAWVDSTSEAAERGTKGHHVAACEHKGIAVTMPTDDPGLCAMIEQARTWRAERFGGDPILRDSLQAEVAFAYDVETKTGRLLVDPPGETNVRWYADRVLRPRYGVKPSEIPGRLDLFGRGVDAKGAYLLNVDYKFHSAVEWSEARAQLEYQALALARTYGINRVKVVALHLWEDVEWHEEAYELDEAALNDIEWRIYLLAFATPANDNAPVPGAHCRKRYCPARATCPVSGEVVGELLPADRLVRRPSEAPAAPFKVREPITGNDHAAFKRVAIDLLKEVAKQLQTEVDAWADAHGGIVDSDGDVYSGKPVTRASPDLSVPGAVELLQERGLFLALQTETTTTWKAIANAGEGKRTADEVRLALEKIGALKTSSYIDYRARKPEPLAKTKTDASDAVTPTPTAQRTA